MTVDGERWDRIEALFHEATGLPREGQSAFLEAVEDESIRVEVAGMLEEDARGASLLDRDLGQVAQSLLGGAPASLKQFGKYRILRPLGEGGMGVVYLAERDDLGSQVAIKILRDSGSSPARRERFVREQKTLAGLNHPSIARLYDADTSPDGTPWFVMEYVDGLPLTDYCEKSHCSIEACLKLFRAVCQAVQYAHEHGVVHRDLKPSNIFVTRDGSVRLLDFGIAKQMDGDSPFHQTRTGMHLLTPAYASPEQMRGAPSTAQSDVYSLGVVFYELLTRRLPFDFSQSAPMEAAERLNAEEPGKPSAVAPRGVQTASWGDLDIICLTAMHKDPERRYGSVEALIRDLEHYLKQEPIEARPDSLLYLAGKFAQRNRSGLYAVAVLLVLVTASAALAFRYASRAAPTATAKTVAVLPFRNATGDKTLDYLSVALANQVAGPLEYVRDVAVRPLATTRQYDAASVNPQQVGRTLHVSYVISGRFVKSGDELQLTMEMIDVVGSRLVWRETFNVPLGNMLAMQAYVVAKTLRGLVSLLGGLQDFAALSHLINDSATLPKSEEAYGLFLHALALPRDIEPTRQARAMLEKSVALDPGYAPAWAELSARCQVQNWFSDGGSEAARCADAALDRAATLDPANVGIVVARAMVHFHPNEIRRSYQDVKELIRRRPDNARAHFVLGYLLRYAGLLDEAERECDTALLIDAQDGGVRSCAVAFMLHGDYAHAEDYLRLNLGSEWEKALSVDLLLRQGRTKEAWDARPATVPQWGAYGVLLAYLQGRPASEIAALGGRVTPNEDAEVNYFSAAHLAYSGLTESALTMLKSAIDGGYCSYPAIDKDPLLSNARAAPQFAGLRAAAIACQENFLQGGPR